MTAPSTDPALTRAALALDDRPLLLAVGRLAEQKDYPTLLAAARTWREHTPQPVVAVVGAGPLHERLAAWICAEGLPVRLLGRRDDVADLLAAADVAVISSTWEARSLYAQEALTAGVPLVATAVGGLPELVGDAALLVPPGRPGALALAVTRVLDEPDLRARLAGAGPVQAATWPTQTQIEAELLALYGYLVDRRAPR
jgi:glycosyltransferase involved in cell wall biosynthesis